MFSKYVLHAQDVCLVMCMHCPSHGPETSGTRRAVPAAPEEQVPRIKGLKPVDLQTIWGLILLRASCETASFFFFLIYFLSHGL